MFTILNLAVAPVPKGDLKGMLAVGGCGGNSLAHLISQEKEASYGYTLHGGIDP